MKYILPILILLMMVGLQSCSESQEKEWITGTKKITVHCLLPANYKELFPNPKHNDSKDITVLFWSPIYNVELKSKWNSVVDERSNMVKHWSFQSAKPVFIATGFQRQNMLMCPGDSVQIKVTSDSIVYSGRGAESLRLQYLLHEAQNKLEKPTIYSFKVKSMNEYLQWNDYSNKRLNTVMTILNTNTSKVTDSVFKIIKAYTLHSIEFGRISAFMALMNNRLSQKERMLEGYWAVFDSTVNGAAAKWLGQCVDCAVPAYYFYQYNRFMVWKKNNLDIALDSSMNTDSKRKMAYYNSLKENYQGLLRERLLQYIIANEFVKDIGVDSPVTDSVLKDYYGQIGFLEYKEWMKNYVDSMRQKQSVVKK